MPKSSWGKQGSTVPQPWHCLTTPRSNLLIGTCVMLCIEMCVSKRITVQNEESFGYLSASECRTHGLATFPLLLDQRPTGFGPIGISLLSFKWIAKKWTYWSRDMKTWQMQLVLPLATGITWCKSVLWLVRQVYEQLQCQVHYAHYYSTYFFIKYYVPCFVRSGSLPDGN